MMQTQGAVANIEMVSDQRGTDDTVALWRLYVLRACYAILAIGQGSIQIPLFLHHAHWTLNSGVAHSFLLALALLSIVGIRYPLRMLPLLVYELLWKTVWLCGIALPLWVANQVDTDTHDSFFEIAPIIVIIPLLPWSYIFSNYLRKPGDRWR